MVNWESVGAAVLGAVFGGVGAGFGVHMSLQKTITVVGTRLEEMSKLCVECRGDVKDHIENHSTSVLDVVAGQNDQHEARITRLEDRMMNGKAGA